MSCSTPRFTIYKSLTNNNYEFTIKQHGSSEPMVLSVSDTFVAKIVKLEDGTQVGSNFTAAKLSPNEDGKIRITIPGNTTGLVTSKGSGVDRWYTKPLYKLVLECNTVNNGNFIATIGEVYVE